MAPRRIIDTTGLLRSEKRIHENGLIEIIHSQDVQPIIDHNKRLQNDRDFRNGFSDSGDMKHVGTVPLIIWQQWWLEEKARRGRHIPMFGKEMHEIVISKLNDPDNKFLRTGLGEIGKPK